MPNVRHTRRSGLPGWVLALVIAVPVLLLLAGVGAVVAVKAMARAGGQATDNLVVTVGGPRPDVEGVKWNHKELLDHLNARGLDLTMHHAGSVTYFGTDDWATESASIYRRDNFNPFNFQGHDKGVVETKVVTPGQPARDALGLAKHPAFVWGRWLFTSPDRELLDRIKKALGG